MPGPFVGNPFAGRSGLFQAAVNDPAIRAVPGGVQQYVWADLRQEYERRGLPLPSGAFQAVNQMLSWAGSQRQASARLAAGMVLAERSGLDQAIGAEMTAPHLDTRALNEMVTGPQHRVVYLTQELVEGEPVLSYRTHDFGFDLPQSLSGLQDQVDESAQISAADYGFEWGGVATPVAILSY
jgi:hypothetical protein